MPNPRGPDIPRPPRAVPALTPSEADQSKLQGLVACRRSPEQRIGLRLLHKTEGVGGGSVANGNNSVKCMQDAGGVLFRGTLQCFIVQLTFDAGEITSFSLVW